MNIALSLHRILREDGHNLAHGTREHRTKKRNEAKRVDNVPYPSRMSLVKDTNRLIRLANAKAHVTAGRPLV